MRVTHQLDLALARPVRDAATMAERRPALGRMRPAEGLSVHRHGHLYLDAGCLWAVHGLLKRLGLGQ